MRIVRNMVGLGLLLGVGSCLTAVAPDPGTETIAAVAGRVVRADGTGVGGPVVAIQLLTEVSGGSARLISSGSVLGADDGRFLFVFLLRGFPPQTGTATISVTAPPGSGLLGRDTSGIPVKMIQGRLATDTAFVQMALRPR